jgi:hypothetical protein
MDGPGELLTLQLGPYANHVAAHYWNAQERLFVYDEHAPVRALCVCCRVAAAAMVR